MTRPILILILFLFLILLPTSPTLANIFTLDHRSLISQSDLTYITPASRSEEGLPIGNGRMGSLVWTTPSAIRFQINRNDVFAVSSATRSFPRAHTDYSSGCAFLDIHTSDVAPDTFTADNFKQHLSIYDGLITLQRAGVSARVIALHDKDILAIEITDSCDRPQPIHVDLRMLRHGITHTRGISNDHAQQHRSVIQTNAHTATSQLHIDGGTILLTQHFRELDHFSASAVATRILGRDARATFLNESTVRLSAVPRKGTFTILVSSAATFDSDADIADVGARLVSPSSSASSPSPGTPGEGRGEGGFSFDSLLKINQSFWHTFWSKSFIRLSSPDNVADGIQKNYHYFLYVLACCSRNSPYPARFGGLLFYTNGDLRTWGSQYWWANQSCYYNGLAPANRPELLDPTFNMYTKIYDACATAAKQQWGSQGIWIPETTFFNGPDLLPDDIAAEMQDLYLLRKPWDQRSNRFRDFEQNVPGLTSRWNWIAQGGRYEHGRWIPEDKGHPPFGHVTHIFGTTAKVAYLYWQRYEYTLDENWLRDRAYPMLKGVIEFYRHFPNLKKESDGKYHIYHTNSNEPAWGVKDSDEDLSALHGCLPLAIRASEILNEDQELRATWKEFLANLAPVPTSDHPDALKPDDYTGPVVWIKGLRPAIKPGGLLPDGNTLPMWNFDLCHVESSDPARLKLANATLDGYFRRRPLGPDSRVGTLSRVPIAAAQMGRADAVKYLLPAQLNASDAARNNAPGIFRNRFALREGPGATECERLGRVAEALHHALLHSAPPNPGQDPILHLFAAFPIDWSADFKLLARGNFLVSGSIDKGHIKAVHLKSQSGASCRLRNPWPNKSITLQRNGKPAEALTGAIIEIPTTVGETITLTVQHPSP